MDDLGKGLSGTGSLTYAENLRIAYREGLNLVILHADENRWDRILSRTQKEQSIDVWWDNDATSRTQVSRRKKTPSGRLPRQSSKLKAKFKAEQAVRTLEQILNGNGKEDINPTGD